MNNLDFNLMETDMNDFIDELSIKEILELPVEQLQEYIQNNLMGLSELNRNTSVLLTRYDDIADSVSLGRFDKDPETNKAVRIGKSYEIFANVLMTVCSEGRLDWHAVNTAHAANLFALEKNAKLTLTG